MHYLIASGQQKLGAWVSRRQVLAALVGVALGGLHAPALAGEKQRKAVKRAKKQSKKKCRNQEGQCAQVFTDLCARNSDPVAAAACTLQFTECCTFLAGCQATAFFDCTFAPR